MDDRDGSWSSSPSPICFWCVDSNPKGVTPPPVDAPVVDSITGAPDPVEEGGDVTFTPTLSGGAPDTYKWTATNGTIKGSDTGNTVTVTAGTAGECSASLTVTNGGGSGSGTGKVVVEAPLAPLTITAQPQNQVLTAGEDLSLTAVASDEDGVTWKWQKDGSDVSGATGAGASATFNKTSSVVGDAGDYTVIFTRSTDSSTVTSDAATVTVN